jgi:glycosyltransferase involved in cell wall biosynthesis
MQSPLPQCWEYLIAALRKLDSLGVIWGRRNNMEEVYRAADMVLTPQRIATRSVGEPLSCGIPVIAAHGCQEATLTVDVGSPGSVADGVERLIHMMTDNPADVKETVKMKAESFSLDRYSKSINELYRKLNG